MSISPSSRQRCLAQSARRSSSRPSASLRAAVRAALAGAALAGCAATTPQWDQHFGDATRIALARQIVAPAAARNADPVAGLDGRAAAQAQQQYQKSFSAAAPANNFVIGDGAAR